MGVLFSLSAYGSVVVCQEVRGTDCRYWFTYTQSRGVFLTTTVDWGWATLLCFPVLPTAVCKLSLMLCAPVQRDRSCNIAKYHAPVFELFAILDFRDVSKSTCVSTLFDTHRSIFTIQTACRNSYVYFDHCIDCFAASPALCFPFPNRLYS